MEKQSATLTDEQMVKSKHPLAYADDYGDHTQIISRPTLLFRPNSCKGSLLGNGSNPAEAWADAAHTLGFKR